MRWWSGRSTAATRRGTKFSPLADINRQNVHTLARRLGMEDRREGARRQFGTRPGKFQNTPLMIDNVLYVSTPYNRVVALDAETGARDLGVTIPKAYEDGQPPNGTGFVHRGVAAWRDGGRAAHLPQQPLSPDLPRRGDRPAGRLVRHRRHRRSQPGPRLADREEPLHEHVAAGRLQGPRHPRQRRRRSARCTRTIRRATCARSTRGPASRCGRSTPIPQPGEFGNDTWQERLVEVHRPHQRLGADDARRARAGCSTCRSARRATTSTAAAATARTSSPNRSSASTPRPASASGTSRSSTTACGTTTSPSPPNLVTITVDGRKIDAVVQLTKQGFAFVFDRVTGKPVWPIEERPVPPSDVPGEQAWPTQPFPTRPPPFAEQGVTLDDAFDLTPELKAAAQAEMKKYRLGPLYTPPSVQGTIMRPGRHRRRQLGRRRVRSGDRRAVREDVEHAELIRIVRPGSLAAEPARLRGRRRVTGDLANIGRRLHRTGYRSSSRRTGISSRSI